MKILHSRFLLVPVLAALLAAPVDAAELQGAQLGKHISGPALTPASLAGKVVVFEYWGIMCPPCLANIPHVSELATAGSVHNLAVIANQCQGGTTTKQVWTSKGGTDLVTVVDGGELVNANVSGIPRVFVFDHTGKQVFDGRPHELTVAMIREWVSASPGPIASKAYPLCAAEVSALANQARPWAAALRSLRAKIAGNQAAAKAEATALLGEATAFLAAELAKSNTEKSTAPHTSLARATKLAAMTKGDTELEKAYADHLESLKADKAFLAEAAAFQAWTPIKEGLAKLASLPADQQAAAKRQGSAAIDGFLKTHGASSLAPAARAEQAKLK